MHCQAPLVPAQGTGLRQQGCKDTFSDQQGLGCSVCSGLRARVFSCIRDAFSNKKTCSQSRIDFDLLSSLIHMACALVSPCGRVDLFENAANVHVNEVLQASVTSATPQTPAVTLQYRWHSHKLVEQC